MLLEQAANTISNDDPYAVRTFTAQSLREALAEVLEHLVNLEEVHLRDCLLRSNGAGPIVKALSDKAKLTSLDLAGNEIGQLVRLCRFADLRQGLFGDVFLDLGIALELLSN